MKITDTHGKEHEIECIACSIQSGAVELPVKRVFETERFVVEQDFEWPVAGFFVIVSKRHIRSVAEMSEEESIEMVRLMRSVRLAMKETLGIEEVTIVQEETSRNSHFHIWLFPWHGWMLERWKGKLSEIREVMTYAKENRSDKSDLRSVEEAAVSVKTRLLES